MSHHLHKETHTIEEAAPIAGHTHGRQQPGLMGKTTNLVAGSHMTGAHTGKEYHVHPQPHATGPYLQEKDTFIKECGGSNLQTEQFATERTEHLTTNVIAQPTIHQEKTTVIRHDEKPEMRTVNVGKQLLTHTEKSVHEQHVEAPLVDQSQQEIIHEHHKNIVQEQHQDVVHEHHKNIMHEHIQPVIHEQRIQETHIPIIHESEKSIIHEKHIPIIHEQHQKKIVEEVRAPVITETTQAPIYTRSVEQPVVFTEQSAAIIDKQNLGTTQTTNITTNQMSNMNLGHSHLHTHGMTTGGQTTLMSGQTQHTGLMGKAEHVISGATTSLTGEQQLYGQQYQGQQMMGGTTMMGSSGYTSGTQYTGCTTCRQSQCTCAGTGGEFIDQTYQKRGMGSKVKGAFHDIKTALIGDRHAANLRQEEIRDDPIMQVQQRVVPTTTVTTVPVATTTTVPMTTTTTSKYTHVDKDIIRHSDSD